MVPRLELGVLQVKLWPFNLVGRSVVAGNALYLFRWKATFFFECQDVLRFSVMKLNPGSLEAVDS